MMRLIDADVLKKAIIKHLCVKSENNLLPAERSIYNLIDEQPTIEQPEWTYFTFRPMTDEEKEYYDMVGVEDAQMLENCPDDGEEVILLTPWSMSIDTFRWDSESCYFDNHDEIEEGWAWMPTPKPPKKDGEQK